MVRRDPPPNGKENKCERDIILGLFLPFLPSEEKIMHLGEKGRKREGVGGAERRLKPS